MPTVPSGGRACSIAYVQLFAVAWISTRRKPGRVPSAPTSGTVPCIIKSGLGAHIVISPVPSFCVPVIVRLITSGSASGSRQSLFAPDFRLPKMSCRLALLATKPNAAAPSGPQLSLHAVWESALIIERNSNRDMGHHRVAEPVVLDDVFEDALETSSCPASFEIERFAEHPELGLQHMAIERAHLRIIGEICQARRHRIRIASHPEVRRGLSVVAVAKRSIDRVADLLHDAQLRRVCADLPVVPVVAVCDDERGLRWREEVAAGDRDRLAQAIVGVCL